MGHSGYKRLTSTNFEKNYDSSYVEHLNPSVIFLLLIFFYSGQDDRVCSDTIARRLHPTNNKTQQTLTES